MVPTIARPASQSTPNSRFPPSAARKPGRPPFRSGRGCPNHDFESTPRTSDSQATFGAERCGFPRPKVSHDPDKTVMAMCHEGADIERVVRQDVGCADGRASHRAIRTWRIRSPRKRCPCRVERRPRGVLGERRANGPSGVFWSDRRCQYWSCGTEVASSGRVTWSSPSALVGADIECLTTPR